MALNRVAPAAATLATHDLTVSVRKRPVSVRVLVPETAAKGALPPLLALHGISRDAAAIEAAFASACALSGRVLIVPRFSQKHWRIFQTIGQQRPDKALLDVLSQVERLGMAQTGRVAVFGYSGGAQLAHRFAMLYPNRIAALHLAAAGWYCLPDGRLPFPMGLAAGDTPDGIDVAGLSRSQLPSFLRLPLRVYVGADDIERDAALRCNPSLDSVQGIHRVARAQSYARALKAAARSRGITPDVNFVEIPGCKHSFTDCASAGLTDLVCTA